MLYYCRFSPRKKLTRGNHRERGKGTVEFGMQEKHIIINRIRKVTWITALVGLLISGYLAYVKIFDTPIYCTPGLGDCTTVNSSSYSELWGIPIAFFGILSYLAIILLVFLADHFKLIKHYQVLIIFGISLFGFLYSLYLTYLEIFVIHAICQWCVLSALCMTIILAASLFWLKQKQESNNTLRRRK
jgi:uncharacterized membrane protein